jgi:hypothetical protein
MYISSSTKRNRSMLGAYSIFKEYSYNNDKFNSAIIKNGEHLVDNLCLQKINISKNTQRDYYIAPIQQEEEECLKQYLINLVLILTY